MKRFITRLFGRNTNADTLAEYAMRRRRPAAHRSEDGSTTFYAEDGTPVVFPGRNTTSDEDDSERGTHLGTGRPSSEDDRNEGLAYVDRMFPDEEITKAPKAIRENGLSYYPDF